MNLEPLKTAGLVSLIMGILFALTGAVTWGVITAQLADENITTPGDAFLPNTAVNNPLAALAQADEFTKQRTTVMNGSFLRASLFTSVLAYGVSLFAIGVGLTLVVLGWALNKVGSQAVARA